MHGVRMPPDAYMLRIYIRKLDNEKLLWADTDNTWDRYIKYFYSKACSAIMSER